MFKTSTLFVLLVISALQLRGQWFYQLPTYKLLKDSCVTEIIVKQFELTPAKGWVTDTKRDPDEKVKPSEQLAHYYINTFGNVDSLIYYHNGKRFGGFILKYDAEGHLIQTHEFRPDRPYMAFNKIKKTEEGFRANGVEWPFRERCDWSRRDDGGICRPGLAQDVRMGPRSIAR